MLNSLIQQVVRQDPACYPKILTLRPDNAWRSISFPCFPQETLSEDEAALNVVQGTITIAGDSDEDWERGELNVFFRGQSGVIKRTKQTISPCFIAIGDDLDTLEVPGLGPVEELSRAHCLLEPPAFYPSEQKRKY